MLNGAHRPSTARNVLAAWRGAAREEKRWAGGDKAAGRRSIRLMASGSYLMGAQTSLLVLISYARPS